MAKLKIFFYCLKQSFTSIDYYNHVVEARISFSLKFFWVYFFFYALIGTAFIGYRYLWPWNDFFVEVVPAELQRVYPGELVIKFEDGAVSTNVDEPYFIPFDRFDRLTEEIEKRVLGTNTMMIQNLLVIDTSAKIEDFRQYQTWALLTKNHLSIMNEEGNVESVPLTEAENFTVDKQMVDEWLGYFTPLAKYVVPLASVGVFVFLAVLLPISRLVFVFFMGLVLLITSKVMRKDLGYWKAFQLNLHFVVISTTFFSLLLMLGRTVDVQWLETGLVTVLGVVVLNKLKNKNEKLKIE